ncbi:MAG: beta/gamma crystallin family protein [Symploca sp. SIO2B6]|nr:beta/gamma crystallin family protein [Symploca sp. SIO2B6]
MSSIDSKLQELHTIPGVEDLSQENAATCSGGAITLYGLRNHRGANISFQGGAISNLNNLNFGDRASSIEITGNKPWRLWARPNFGGLSKIFLPGKYNLGIILNNNVESIARID